MIVLVLVVSPRFRARWWPLLRALGTLFRLIVEILAAFSSRGGGGGGRSGSGYKGGGGRSGGGGSSGSY